MILNKESYFSKEANMEYMSVSQFKNFQLCEAKALNDLTYELEEKKDAFLEGHLFEELVAGDPKLFIAQHTTDLISSRGETKGQIKKNFKKVENAAESFNNQKFFRDIIDKCEKQVILTGEIEGIKVKCALDLFDRKTNSIYDIKCMSNFSEQWNSNERRYVPWYYAYGYILQLAVYREIVRQNFGEPKEICLIAATKEEIPDLSALSFNNCELLDLEMWNFKDKIKHFDNVKKGIEEPIHCRSM